MWLRDTGRAVSIKGINGKVCVMVLVCFIIKMEECMKENGDSTKCRAKENSTISLANLPTRVTGQMISSRVWVNFITSILKSQTNLSTTRILMRSMRCGPSMKVNHLLFRWIQRWSKERARYTFYDQWGVLLGWILWRLRARVGRVPDDDRQSGWW